MFFDFFCVRILTEAPVRVQKTMPAVASAPVCYMKRCCLCTRALHTTTIGFLFKSLSILYQKIFSLAVFFAFVAETKKIASKKKRFTNG